MLVTISCMKSRCSGRVLGFELQGALRALDQQRIQKHVGMACLALEADPKGTTK